MLETQEQLLAATIMGGKIAARESFTAYDVTEAVRKTYPSVVHQDMRSFVHAEMQVVSTYMAGLHATSSAILYEPVSDPGVRTQGTDIVVILDRSASMRALTDTTIDGFNKFLSDQQALPGKAEFTLVQFANKSVVSKHRVNLSDVHPLNTDTYRATGDSTALYDAICETLEREIENNPDNDRKVVIAVLTDGYENSSRQHNRSDVEKIIGRCQNELKWEILFLSSELGAVREAKDWGLKLSNVSYYDATPKGLTSAFRGINYATTQSRSGQDLGDIGQSISSDDDLSDNTSQP